MDRNLRCNVLRCGAEVRDAGWVTACSHIFCEDCAVRHGLTTDDYTQRVCPACNHILAHEFHVMQNHINPPEEWMANVLAGLSPSVVMECAGKALSFWSYQMIMEIALMDGKIRGQCLEYETMSSQYRKEMDELKSVIDRQNKEIENLTATVQDQHQAFDSVSNQLKDKSQKLHRVQELYDKIKRQAQLEEIQHTASQSVGARLDLDAGSILGQQPSPREIYPLVSAANQRYSNSHVGPPYSHGTTTNLSTGGSTMQGRANQAYTNAYSGVLGIHNTTDGRTQPRVHSTPQPYLQRPAGATSMGLSNVQGVVAGTPRGAVKGTPRVRSDPPAMRIGDPRQSQRPPVPFPLAGQVPGAPGLNASRHTPSTSGANYDRFSVPTLSSRAGYRETRPAGQGYQQGSSRLNLGHGAVVGSRGYERE